MPDDTSLDRLASEVLRKRVPAPIVHAMQLTDELHRHLLTTLGAIRFELSVETDAHARRLLHYQLRRTQAAYDVFTADSVKEQANDKQAVLPVR